MLDEDLCHGQHRPGREQCAQGGRRTPQSACFRHCAQVAAGPIRRFIDLVHDNAGSKGIHMGCYGSAADYGIDETIAAEGLKLFEEALAAADSDEVRRRVEKTSACAYRTAIEPVWIMKDQDELDLALAERMRPLVKRFFEICDEYGVTHSSGASSIADSRDRLKKVFGLSETETF